MRWLFLLLVVFFAPGCVTTAGMFLDTQVHTGFTDPVRLGGEVRWQ